MSEIYYKIFIGENGMLSVSCLQWFDELESNDEDFFKDEYGRHYRFDTEEEATEWLNEFIRPELIEYDHRKINREDYFI